MPVGLGGFVFLGARMECYVMTVVCRSHVSSLARVVSVLHARRAAIAALRFVEGPATSRVVIDIRGGDGLLLAAQLRRAVDVVSVEVTVPVPVVAVAS
jgi:acetolactate synthase small subunit